MSNKMNNELTTSKIVWFFEDAVENRKAAIEYKPFTNPNMLIWNFLIGREENLTIMMQGDPIMSNLNGRNTITFESLRIYLISQTNNSNVGISNILDIPDLTVDKLIPAVKIFFERHNLMASAEHNEHHVFFEIELEK